MTPTFADLIDIASERLGASVVAANDEFFAPKENLIRADAPRWREGECTERGKWMDGWETRCRRGPGDDWCIIRLGVAGIPRGVDVETTHFKGNFPESCAIDVCDVPGVTAAADLLRAAWAEILPQTFLSGDAHNCFAIDRSFRATRAASRDAVPTAPVPTSSPRAPPGASSSRRWPFVQTPGTPSRMTCARSVRSLTSG